MLINFKFSNYKSFKDEAEFSMEPLTNNGSISNAIETGYKKAPCVYRTSAIFGANASGKSNFIEAMLFFRMLVIRTYRNSTTSKFNIPIYKLAVNKENTTFEVEFLKNGYVYKYFVELNNDSIVKEEAYYNETSGEGREKCLFRRTSKDFNSPYGIDKNLAMQTINTRLLIGDLINNKNYQDKFVSAIYNWFAEDLLTLFNISIMAYTANIDETNINRVSKFLNKADIDIVNFVIKDGKTYAIQKDENNNDVLFDFSKETSLGTKTLIAVSRFVDDALTNGKVLFVDELDTALHPHLVKYLVELFNNPETNPKGAQLIFTSHAHYLMDGEHLTRDQIWFVSKENGYSSDLYSLSDFKQIKRKKGAFYNEYMYGIFGAIPNINGD